MTNEQDVDAWRRAHLLQDGGQREPRLNAAPPEGYCVNTVAIALVHTRLAWLLSARGRDMTPSRLMDSVQFNYTLVTGR